MPIKNFYGNVFYFHDGYIKASTLTITSKLPLYLQVNDPKELLKVVEVTKDGVHRINIVLEKPTFEWLTNEPFGIINDKYQTWVSLSSVNSWENLAQKLVAKYDAVTSQALPKMFATIAEAAASKNGDEAQINFVTSTLNEQITYMGDWRTVKGRLFPRDLKQIANTQVGDCKDFFAATAAILQRLGYKVLPILVERGEYVVNQSNKLPYLGAFNHVMLKLIKESKIYWIDPTNAVSLVQGIFPDIEDRDALVLDYTEAGFTRIPAIKHCNSKVVWHNEFFINNNVVKQQGTITLQGESALWFSGMGLNYSNEQLRDIFFQRISGKLLTEAEKQFLALPDLTSRIVKDLHIEYAFQCKNLLFKTNLGSVLKLIICDGQWWFNAVVSTADDQIGDLFIGRPYTIEMYHVIKNVHVKNCKNLDFSINTSWLSVNRSCKYTGNDTEIKDTIVVMKRFITNEALQSMEYKHLKNKLESDFGNAAIVIA